MTSLRDKSSEINFRPAYTKKDWESTCNLGSVFLKLVPDNHDDLNEIQKEELDKGIAMVFVGNNKENNKMVARGKKIILKYPSDREFLINYWVKLVNDTKYDSCQPERSKVWAASIVPYVNVKTLTSLPKKELKEVLAVCSKVLGPREMASQLKGAYFKLKRKAGK